MRPHTKRRRSRKENLRTRLLARVHASVLFVLPTYWVGITAQGQRAGMGDQFVFIKAVVFAHAMAGAMGTDRTPRLPCPDLRGNVCAAYTYGPDELGGYVPWRTLEIDEG